MKAIIKKSYLKEIPHEGGKLGFQYPAFRRSHYRNIGEAIDKERLKRPNSAETASLIYDAFQNPKGAKESEIIQLLKDHHFVEFTGNLYLPKGNGEIQNGVILETNPQVNNEGLFMDKSSLIKRLQNNDELVKFVPFGYKRGEQTGEELIKNPYIIARYGEEGAEKIGEIASKYRGRSGLWCPKYSEEHMAISILRTFWTYGDGLNIFAYDGLDGERASNYDCHAFGVFEE